MGSGPGSPFGLEDKAPGYLIFEDLQDPQIHVQETRGS